MGTGWIIAGQRHGSSMGESVENDKWASLGIFQDENSLILSIFFSLRELMFSGYNLGSPF